MTSTTRRLCAGSVSGRMFWTWRVFVPEPRVTLSIVSGPMSRAVWAPPPGPDQTASSSAVVAAARQVEPAGT